MTNTKTKKKNEEATTRVMRWISWEQEGADGRPVKWPPPPQVLGFWESGFSETHTMVVALVEADEHEAKKIITRAWSPGMGDWRFNEEHDVTKPPGDRFGAPDWAVELKRWPWTNGKLIGGAK